MSFRGIVIAGCRTSARSPVTLFQARFGSSSMGSYLRVSMKLIGCVIAIPMSINCARAQIGETLLLPAVVPPGFNRDHNQSVLELPRRSYDPVGVQIGSFKLSPSVRSGAGVTSNTYYTADPIASAFLTNTPSAQLVSQWNRHELMLSTTATFREYAGQPRRNETTWQIDERGRIDVGRFTSVTLEEISSLLNENQFTGETTPTFAALSRYRRDFFSARGVHAVGRMRLTLATDYAFFRYQPLPLITGGTTSQESRNRNIARITGQYEYARSPNFALFMQASYATQAFEIPLSETVPNLDSRAYRVLFGANFDDPGFARGSIGIGYTHQTFDATIYRPVGGVSVEGHLDLFPSTLTTVSLGGRRTLEITYLGVRGAYWDNRANLRIDREIWRSILLNINGEYSKQNYVSSNVTANSYQIGVGGQYLSSRRVALDISINYGDRGGASNVTGNRFSELRSEVGMTFRI